MGCDIMRARKGQSGTGLTEKRILMLGLDNAGKTSILLQFKENSFMPSSVPTIGLNIEQVQFRDYNLTFWDVGGQATKLWRHYFDTVDGLIFVIDSTDKTRIQKAKSELYRVAKDPALLQVPYLLLFNKIDIEDKRMTLEELIQEMDVQALSQNRIINFQECSAMTGAGVWEGLTTLIEIFERSSAKTSGPSTGTDLTLNKDATDRAGVDAAIPGQLNQPNTKHTDVLYQSNQKAQKPLQPGIQTQQQILQQQQ